MTATINRSDLMQDAWTRTREMMAMFGYEQRQLRSVFASCLRKAWAAAKEAACLAAISIEDLTCTIEAIENTDRLGFDGIECLARLRRLRAEKIERSEWEAKRALIASAGGRFCSVEFIKKDGTVRRMKVQPATLRHQVKGEQASDTARRASATRAVNHPNLMPVWDAEKQAPRSVNLATVTRIAAGGQVHTF